MKTPIRRLDSLTHNDTAATKLINDNFEALQQGVEDALSRSGKKPNFMDDVLDMNMHRIINIADPIDDYDLANKHYVDTKVSEEETRAKAAEQAEKEARIAADNVLDGKITAEANRAKSVEGTLSNLTTTNKSNLVAAINEVDAHADSISATISGYGNIVTHNVNEFATAAQGAKADTAVQPADVGNGTITLTQGGTTKGTFTTNQKTNTTINLDASSNIQLKNLTFELAEGFTHFAYDATHSSSSTKKYFPVVIVNDTLASHIAPTCTFDGRYVDFEYDGTEITATGNEIILIEINDDSNPVSGITNGIMGIQTKANLVTSLSASSTDTEYPSAKCVYDAIQNAGELPNPVVTRVPTFSGTTKGYIDVSDLTEVGAQYIPIVTTSSSTSLSGSSITEACKNLKSQCEYDYTNRRIILDYIDSTYVNTNHFSYSFILIPQQSGYSSYVYGITDGLNGYLSDAQTTGNLVTSISGSSTDAQYPSAKCVYDALQNAGGLAQPIFITNTWFRNDTNEDVLSISVRLSVEYQEGISYIPFVWLLGDTLANYITTAYIEPARYGDNKGYDITIRGNTQNIPAHSSSNSQIILLPVKDDVYIAQYYGSVNNGNILYQLKSSLVTSLSSSSTDTEYPSAKCVYDIVGNIETLLQNV